MKRLLSSIMFVLMACSTAFSQSAQNGIVKEYNEAKKKTPLAGVEIVVNNAGSNVSAKNGKFVLSFRTLKPGDKVEVRKIEKAGYEIFNKDALEAWRIANDGSEFAIVLCKSAKFKTLKDQYNAVASKSYAQQQKKDEQRLASLLKEGKLQQAEYEKKLKELKDKYDEQLENLDNYIDRFARIDLETISKEEQNIIEMVKEGKIEEAIAAYEAMNLEEKYAQAVKNIGIATDAISQLEKIKTDNEKARVETFAAVKRMNDARRLQGGEENYNKIQQSLRSIALADTTDLVEVKNYADYALEEKDFDDALFFYNICLRGYANDKTMLFKIYNNIGNVYYFSKRMELAEWNYQKTFSVLSELVLSESKYIPFFAMIMNNLGSIYNHNSNKNEQAIDLYKKTVVVWDSLSSHETKYFIDKVKALSNLGDSYRLNREYEHAEETFKEALYIYENQLEEQFKSDDIISTIYYNIALMYEMWGVEHFNDAEKNYMCAIEKVSDKYKNNPDKYGRQLCDNYSRMAILFFRQNDMAESMRWKTKEKDLLESLYKSRPKLYTQELAKTCYILADYHAGNNSLEEATRLIIRAIDLVDNIPDYYYVYGTILLLDGKDLEALKQWRRILSLSPDYYENLVKIEAPTILPDKLKEKGLLK